MWRDEPWFMILTYILVMVGILGIFWFGTWLFFYKALGGV